MSKFAMPALLFPFSYFFGTFSVLLPSHYQFGTTQVFYSSAFASCAAAWGIIPAIISRAKWRFLEIVCLSLLGLLALTIIRPLWLSEFMVRLPLLKSMRWPFREILQFQFFLHLFLIIRSPGGSLRAQRLILFIGIFIFTFPLLFLEAPSFQTMTLDRKLLFSGNMEYYWKQVKPLLGNDGKIAVVADINMINDHPFDVPYTLLGTYNYPILIKIKSVTGYSVAPPINNLYIKTLPAWHIGVFSPEQKAAVMLECGDVRFITLESIKPLRITLSFANHSVIDLTPYIPK